MNGSIQVGFYTERSDSISLNIYLSGCRNNKKCDIGMCHNQSMRKFDYGTDVRLLYPRIQKILQEGIIDSVVLLGGEPFDQEPNELRGLISFIKNCNNTIPIYAYSGYDFDTIAPMAEKLGLKEVCCGPYKEGQDTKRWFVVN